MLICHPYRILTAFFFLFYRTQPVYLRIDLTRNAGTVKCCLHAPFECLPVMCRCCQLFASVTINVVDMSDYLVNTRKSFDNVVAVDSNFLHDSIITRDMLTHDPYTPESAESHSPRIEKIEPAAERKKKTSTVSPHELKTKLEGILRLENTKSQKFLMKRSASQHTVDESSKVPKCKFRERAMSEIPKKSSRARLISDTSTLSITRLQSHHSSSDEDWFEFDEPSDERRNDSKEDIIREAEEEIDSVIGPEEAKAQKRIIQKRKSTKSKCMKRNMACCSVM